MEVPESKWHKKGQEKEPSDDLLYYLRSVKHDWNYTKADVIRIAQKPRMNRIPQSEHVRVHFVECGSTPVSFTPPLSTQ